MKKSLPALLIIFIGIFTFTSAAYSENKIPGDQIKEVVINGNGVLIIKNDGHNLMIGSGGQIIHQNDSSCTAYEDLFTGLAAQFISSSSPNIYATDILDDMLARGLKNEVETLVTKKFDDLAGDEYWWIDVPFAFEKFGSYLPDEKYQEIYDQMVATADEFMDNEIYSKADNIYDTLGFTEKYQKACSEQGKQYEKEKSWNMAYMHYRDAARYRKAIEMLKKKRESIVRYDQENEIDRVEYRGYPIHNDPYKEIDDDIAEMEKKLSEKKI